MLFFTAAMCRRAINIRWTKPRPGPFGGCTRSHPGLSPVRPSRAAFLFTRLAGERGGEAANLSMCSRPPGLYKARVSDLLELAKVARELAAAFRPALRRHGDSRRRGGHGHRRPHAARGRGLRTRRLLETLGGRWRQERSGHAEPRRGGDARWPWNDRSLRKAFPIQAPSQ
nr:protein ripply2 isoform X1 [Symphalangus syndactylus]